MRQDDTVSYTNYVRAMRRGRSKLRQFADAWFTRVDLIPDDLERLSGSPVRPSVMPWHACGRCHWQFPTVGRYLMHDCRRPGWSRRLDGNPLDGP